MRLKEIKGMNKINQLINKQFKFIFIFLSFLNLAFADNKNDLKILDDFIKNTKNGTMNFNQIIEFFSKNKKEKNELKQQKSTGKFYFQRPDLFKFVYENPFEQIILGDGEFLWSYDIGLEQIIKNKQTNILNNTPAAIFITSNNLNDLKKDFEFKTIKKNNSNLNDLKWIEAKPKDKESLFQYINLGFENKNNNLKFLEIIDGFNQKTIIEFDNINYSNSLSKNIFKLEFPENIDILEQ